MTGASGPNWTDLTIAGIPAAALIVGVVKLGVEAGVPRKWAPLLACAIGLVVGLAAEVATLQGGAAGWIDAALVGLWIGLGAVGGHAAVTHTNLALSDRSNRSNRSNRSKLKEREPDERGS